MKLRQLIKSAALGLSGLALTCPVQADEPLLTNTTSFRIPFSVDGASSQTSGGYAVLFVSLNGGPMRQVQRVPANAGGFRFAAPSDGTYQFAVRMTDRTGTPLPSDGALRPELEVIVDTTAPELKLNAFDAGNGTAQIKWQCADSIDPGSLLLEYAEDANGQWKALAVAQTATGEAVVHSRPGTPLAIRGRVSDPAGNTGQVSQQIVLGARVNPATPSQVQPVVPTAPGSPVGPSPFGATRPTIPLTASQPGIQAARSATTAQPISNPVASPPSYPVMAQPASQTNAGRIVSNPVFNIAYQVEDIGPSGVSAVELYLTEDNGQQWFRYGEDTDQRSPVLVDVRGEGTYGFVIRVRNGVGFSDPPPQPGEVPEIVVTVDQTPPAVELAAPTVRSGASPAVLVQWNQMTQESVDYRLEFATSAAGPWTPLFDWQANRSGYEWPIQANVPPSVYFRLLARDAIGNIATAQSSQPTIIDLKRPRARMLSIQPAEPVGIGY